MERSAMAGFAEALQHDEALAARFTAMAENLPADADPIEAMASFAQANGHAVTVTEMKRLAACNQAATNGGSLSDAELESISGGMFGNGTFLIDPNGTVGSAIGSAGSAAFGWFHRMMTGR